MTASSPTILIIGRSQPVLDGAVKLLAERGLSAQTTNDFENVPAQIEARELELVVFGGQIPPAKNDEIRTQLRALAPSVTFLQGLGGIPGLIADQIQAALDGERPVPGQAPLYDAERRAIVLNLFAPLEVRVIVYWVTAMIPPDPTSESRLLFEGHLPAGEHHFQIPEDMTLGAAFATLHAADASWSFRLT